MPPTVDDLPGVSWRALCEDPRFAFLADRPFKVETNQSGQIIMSPTRIKHGFFQSRIAQRLMALAPEPGESTTEPAVETSEGVKVADVGWFTAEHFAQVREEFAATSAPAICVEVLSPYNTSAEIAQKQHLYFEAGAEEVWTCDAEGRMRFFDRHAERERSALVPDFPTRVGDDAPAR